MKAEQATGVRPPRVSSSLIAVLFIFLSFSLLRVGLQANGLPATPHRSHINPTVKYGVRFL